MDEEVEVIEVCPIAAADATPSKQRQRQRQSRKRLRLAGLAALRRLYPPKALPSEKDISLMLAMAGDQL